MSNKTRVRDNNGKWLNSNVFREEALNFIKNGYYTSAPYGSPDWVNYWEEQLKRTKEGFEVNGHKITGHHYFYLNFTQIQLAVFSKDEDSDSSVAYKETRNPDFWDGDYDFFWSLEIARNGLFTKNTQVPSTEGEKKKYNALQKEIKKLKKEFPLDYQNKEEYKDLKKERDYISEKVLKRLGLRVKPSLDHVDGGYHFIISKSRRKGYSYKTGSIASNVYNNTRKAQVIIGAYEKKFLYPEGTMSMASEYLNFLNENTGWAKSRDYVNKQDHKKASYKTTVGGVDVEKGYKSQILALTFGGNPDAARGKDAVLVILEEAGAFSNLKDSYNAIYPALTAGSFLTGQIVILGTGGDMGGGTVDFADMFYNPIPYRLMPFYNIWDDNAENTLCGFFHSTTWNMEGFYDEQGNSDVNGAYEFEMSKRHEILTNSTTTLLNKRVQEYPLSPSEAFLTTSTNNFPVVELRNQLNKVIQEKLQFKKGTCVELDRKDGKVIAIPDLKNKLQPIINYKPKQEDLSGCPIIYEYPINNPPKGLYKIGYDPYRQDLSSGVSLASIIVYKGVYQGQFNNNCIVAEYVGRPQEADDVNRIASMLCDLYNAEVMHENEVTHVKNYFRRIKRLDQLAVQPDSVISKNIKSSKVSRVYGCHMNDILKDAGEKYIKDWLLEVSDYDENGSPIYNLEKIYSVGLLEELIQYNRKGNFDRVMALIMCMFFVQEEEIGKDYGKSNNEENNFTAMIKLMDNFNLKRK